MRICKDGSCLAQLIFGLAEDHPEAIAIDGSGIYVHADRLQGWGTGVLARIDKDGGNVVAVASDFTLGGYTSPVAVDDDAIYALTRSPAGPPDRLVRFGKDSGGLVILAEGAIGGVAVDASHVFVSRDDTKELVRVPKGGGPAEKLRSTTTSTLVLDADRVYWIEGGGAGLALHSMGKDGTHVTSFPLPANANPSVIAVDDACVYWASNDLLGAPGSIVTIAKQR
jgi:hypothetical protein